MIANDDGRGAWRKFWLGQPHDAYAKGIVYEIGSGQWLGFVRVQFPDRDNLISWWLNVGVRKTQNDKDWWIPDVGELVTCLMDRDYENGTVLCANYSTKDLPPAGATVDMWIKQFSDGTIISYNRATHALVATLAGSGTAEVTAPGGLNLNGVKIDANGNITVPGTAAITGATTIAGAVTMEQSASVGASLAVTGDVTGGSGISLTQHVHTGVTQGSSNTGTPTG